MAKTKETEGQAKASQNQELKTHNRDKPRGPGSISNDARLRTISQLENGSYPYLPNGNGQQIIDTRPIVLLRSDEEFGTVKEFDRETGAFKRTAVYESMAENLYNANLHRASIAGEGSYATKKDFAAAGVEIKPGQKPWKLAIKQRRQIDDPENPGQKKWQEYTEKEISYYDVTQTTDRDKARKGVQDLFLKDQEQKRAYFMEKGEAEKANNVRAKLADHKMKNTTLLFDRNPSATPRQLLGDAIAFGMAAQSHRVYGKIEVADQAAIKEAALKVMSAKTKDGKDNVFAVSNVIADITRAPKGKPNKVEMNIYDFGSLISRNKKEKEKDSSPAPSKEKNSEMALF